MTSDVEPAKKVLLPYLQRADELQKHEPLVAYYCRLYGMERGLKIPAKERTKTTNAILVSLMNQLEKDKKSVQISPDDNMYVEGFALNVFAKADKQDRAGRADLNTAKTFYAASIFIEILHQFGPLQPDIEQKQKYAVWKAADIRKALSEGRKPVPGPPGGDEDLSISPRVSMDLVMTPNNAAAEGLEGRSFVQQASRPGFGANLDGGSKISSQAPQPDQHDFYGSAPDHGTPQQPHVEYGHSDHHGIAQPPPVDFTHPGHTQSGYASTYPGTYHPSIPADRAAASSPMAASTHGSVSQLDAYSSQLHTQPHTRYYPEYTQTAASGPMYSSLPTMHMGNNGGSDAVYHQSLDRDSSAVSYPASAPFSTDYSFFGGQDHAPSAQSNPASAPFSGDYSSFANSNDPSGLGRTTSAPVSPIKVHTYQPTPEKIAEAQKAARFAVSALAFDDVPTAVSYLKQSLELLTKNLT